jgi:hypothetical protein
VVWSDTLITLDVTLLSDLQITVEAISSLLNAGEGEPADAEGNELDVIMSSSDAPLGQQQQQQNRIRIFRQMITKSLSSSGAINSMLCSVKAMFSYVLTCSQSANPMRVTTIGRLIGWLMDR